MPLPKLVIEAWSRAPELELTKQGWLKRYKAVIEVMKQAVARGDPIEIPGVGTLTIVKLRKPRYHWSVFAKKYMQLYTRQRVVRLKPGKEWTEDGRRT